MGLIVALAAFAALLVFPAACKQVSTETLHNNANKEETDVKPAEIALDATAAFDETPRTLERVRISSSMFARALEYESARSYETLWKAARTEAWIAEYSTDNVERERHANRGITYANTALKLKEGAAEATFFHGVLAGFIGDLDHDYGLDAVSNIEADMKLLMDSDTDFANGGPWRVFGVLQLRAPGPPVSIGSLRNGKKNLEKALEKAPDWPENHLYMAEAELMWASEKDKPEFKDQARERLEKYLLGADARAPAGYETEFAVWQEKARALLEANK
ncbi:MAG: hypothetical protein H6839_14495 [Planctomycetes bacterium]|nr:hypothetical protein [Planctomycetota bacterium]